MSAIIVTIGVDTVEDAERRMVEAALEYFEGDKRTAADALGMSLKTLYNKLHRYSSRDGKKHKWLK